jgi:hypothetical protein
MPPPAWARNLLDILLGYVRRRFSFLPQRSQKINEEREVIFWKTVKIIERNDNATIL